MTPEQQLLSMTVREALGYHVEYVAKTGRKRRGLIRALGQTAFTARRMKGSREVVPYESILTLCDRDGKPVKKGAAK